MTRASQCALFATLFVAGASAAAADHDRSLPRTRSIADPVRGPNHGATVLIPPGVDDVAVAVWDVTRAYGGATARGVRPGVSGPTSDWRNSGGNAERNGLSSQAGPFEEVLLWRGGPPSIIGWQAFTEGGRMFVVRQNGYPPQADDSVIYAFDLQTGAEIWRQTLPLGRKNQWITWIAGVNNGVVYASRSGARVDHGTRLFALAAATGDVLWSRGDRNAASAYDGVVFAPDGDPIIGSFAKLMRVDAQDGSILWLTPRVCSASWSCGAALYGNAVYIAELTAGGQQIARHDLATGTRAYASPVMPGSVLQNTPMVGPDGTVYLSRAEDNQTTDFFYAFQDTGTALVEKWHVPAAWTPFSEFAVGPDGSVYMFAPSYEIHRLDPATGETLDASPAISFDIALRARMAIDSAGRLYVSNGGFASGRLYAFTADLTLLWDTPVPYVNIGGPSLGAGGRLTVSGVDDIRVYSDQNARPIRK